LNRVENSDTLRIRETIDSAVGADQLGQRLIFIAYSCSNYKPFIIEPAFRVVIGVGLVKRPGSARALRHNDIV
jgi:hypothetical protein